MYYIHIYIKKNNIDLWFAVENFKDIILWKDLLKKEYYYSIDNNIRYYDSNEDLFYMYKKNENNNNDKYLVISSNGLLLNKYYNITSIDDIKKIVKNTCNNYRSKLNSIAIKNSLILKERYKNLESGLIECMLDIFKNNELILSIIGTSKISLKDSKENACKEALNIITKFLN